MTEVKNIILTGATGIIGRSIIEKLCSVKDIVNNNEKNKTKIEKKKKKFNKIVTIQFDISNHNSIENFINECDGIFQNKIKS